MRTESSLFREIIVTTLNYVILGILAIPVGIVYAALLAIGYNAKVTLLLLLAISVPCTWFVWPHVERWLSAHLLTVKPYNLAAPDCETVQILDHLGMQPALTAAAAFSLLLYVGGMFEIRGLSEDQNTIVSRPYHELSF